jgi:hypothetical protein
MLDLTKEDLSRFVGGQAEAQNNIEEYLYRGEIEEIKVVGDTANNNHDLSIKFAWLAKYDYAAGQWKNYHQLNYTSSLFAASANDIGDNRIAISFPFSKELLVLFPNGGSRLDPNEVIGLSLG